MKKVVVVVAVIALGAFLVYKMSSKPTPKDPKDALHSILNSSKSQDFQVRDALVQLAYHQDPEVLKLALARAGNESAKIRAGAGEVLGFFETPESEAALTKLLADADPAVRLQTLRGLYHVKSPSRIALIRAQLKKADLSESERLKLKEVLFRSSDDPQDKKDSVEALVAYARSGKTPKHYQSGLMAASLSPKDPNVLKYIKDMMRMGQEPAFVSTAIYLFADARDAEVAGNLRRFLKDPQPSVRAAAASTVVKYCQKDRFQVLKEALTSERDPMIVRSITDALKMMPGKAATAATEAAMKSGSQSGESLKLIEAAWTTLKSDTQGRDPCEHSSAAANEGAKAPQKPRRR